MFIRHFDVEVRFWVRYPTREDGSSLCHLMDQNRDNVNHIPKAFGPTVVRSMLDDLLKIRSNQQFEVT